MRRKCSRVYKINEENTQKRLHAFNGIKQAGDQSEEGQAHDAKILDKAPVETSPTIFPVDDHFQEGGHKEAENGQKHCPHYIDEEPQIVPPSNGNSWKKSWSLRGEQFFGIGTCGYDNEDAA